MKNSKHPSILYCASFPPRECGIATFTKRLTEAIDKEFSPEIKSKILAINSNGTSIYNYPRKVVMQINETELEDYLNRAHEINNCQDIRLVNIQHEYGLFGGEQGEFLIPFMELLKKPIVVTMHTILRNPDEKMKKVAQIISKKSAGIVIMNHNAKKILHDNYGIQKEKLHVIPHGVFHIPFPSKSKAKKLLNLDNKIVISTFGMISKDKGIEYAIEALPKVIEEHPNVIYLIIGATHPQVLKEEGEKYRNKLKKIIQKHKLEDYVKFYNHYLTEKEVVDYLRATDIYVYPILSRQQASSGSLSDAMACGCPTITTKTQYAESVINEERGRFVRFKNSQDITKHLLELLNNVPLRKEMLKNAYFFTRHMTWQNVALSYFELFNKCAKIVPQKKGKLPPIKIDYLKNLTDNFGMIQFANHTRPDKHSGYCLDDNARALIACVEYYKIRKSQGLLKLIKLYLDFIKFTQKSNGKFHNFINYHQKFTDTTESQDSFGRAIWALGSTISSDKLPTTITEEAQKIFDKAQEPILELSSLRAIAFAITGLSRMNRKKKDPVITELIKTLGDKLIKSFEEHANDKWIWFEDCFTYSNYKLPEVLFRVYQISKDKKYLQVAEKTMRFLMSITFENKKYFSPIGQDGWYFKDGKRAYFDQQPEDAATAVESLVLAFQVTGNKEYKKKAKIAFEWFLGKNHLNQMVYDEATGGSYDGLGKYSINFNQGAESSVSYLLARLAIEKITE